MRTIIIYESSYHGNTKKLVDAIAAKHNLETATVAQAATLDLSQYDCIGLAAGIAYGHFYRKLRKFAASFLPSGKKVFLLYTCGKETGHYALSMQSIVSDRNCELLGTYGCLGLYTFLFYKTAKGHPDENDINGAVKFYESICPESA